MRQYERRLPHWEVLGQPMFVTFRLHGSLPARPVFPPARLTSGQAFVAMDRMLDEAQHGPLFLRQPEIARLVIQALAGGEVRFLRYRLHAFVVMPNHVHGIIVITGRGEASVPPDTPEGPSGSDASPLRQPPHGTQPGSLSAIVQNFKSISTRRMNAARHAPGAPVWLRNYYERIVRSEQELKAIREYIQGNPARWDEDENNPLRLD